nr:MAG TPA: antitoxin [Caudoviricetes sp.]
MISITQRLLAEALKEKDQDAFVSDWALSSIWGDDPEEANIPQYRIDYLTHLWEDAHKSVREIRAMTGLTRAAFGAVYQIPPRTIENWEYGRTKIPIYIRLALVRMVREDFPGAEEGEPV